MRETLKSNSQYLVYNETVAKGKGIVQNQAALVKVNKTAVLVY